MMFHLLQGQQDRSRASAPKGTTLCESCGEACTAEDRREARLNQYHEAAQNNILLHR